MLDVVGSDGPEQGAATASPGEPTGDGPGQPRVDLTDFEATGRVDVRRGDHIVASIVLPRPRARKSAAAATGTPETRQAETSVVLSRWAYSAGKRLFDLVLGSLLVVLALPVMIVIGIAIWIEDGWPVFYTQARGGKDGKSFRFLKFRSMIRRAEDEKDKLWELNESADGVIFKIRADPRVTRVGAFLRRTSLDELPQLFHVLSGKMSLVGPRPHPVAEVAVYDEEARVRLATKPGVTCLSGRSAG